MADKGTLELVAEHLALAVRPLRRAVADLESFRVFMLRLGWWVESLPAEYEDLADLVADVLAVLDSLDESPDIPEVLALLDKVKALHAAVRGLSERPIGVDPGASLADLGERIFELLLVDYLAAAVPRLYNLLEMLGVLDVEGHEGTATRPTYLRTRLRYDEIPRVVSDPSSIPERVYGWGTQDLDFQRIAMHGLELFTALGVPAYLSRVDPAVGGAFQGSAGGDFDPIGRTLKIPFVLDHIGNTDVEVGLALLKLPADGDTPPGIVLQPLVSPQLGLEYEIDDDVTLVVRAGTDLAAHFGILLRPGEPVDVRYPFQPGATLPSAGFGVELVYAPETPRTLLGSPKASRLQLAGLTSGLFVDFKAGELELRLGLALEGLAAVIALGEQDSFIGGLFGGSDLTIPIPLAVQWSSKTGLGFAGGAGFAVAVYPHLALGPITIDEVRLAVRATAQAGKPPDLLTEVGLVLSGALGPLAFAVEEIGVRLTTVFQDGNAGPFDVAVGFKPPTGLGLVVDGGAVAGGGFLSLDHANGRYAGMLQPELATIAITAIGLLDTRLPGGAPGFSFLIIVTARFPPIQLGYGFTLNGVGGLAGIHRTIVVEALQAGIRTGSVDHILFPEDPARDAPQIISDLRTIFPPAAGRYVFGPMAIIGYGTPTMIEAELGIVLELPNPVRLVLLGQVNAALPHKEAAVVDLHLDILGIVDFAQKLFSLDAVLHDSRIAQFAVDGEMAVRLAWGDQPSFALAVGGLHPRFQPPPGFPTLRRLTLAVGTGPNPRLDLQAYLALTSNTLQVGAQAELYAEKEGFNLRGWIGFDALFTFTPFAFVADLGADVALRLGDTLVGAIHLQATLTGPTPWHAWGEAYASVLHRKVPITFDVTFGEPRAVELPPSNPWDELKSAIEEPRNWSATLPPSAFRVVSIAEPPAGEQVAGLVDPVGGLTLRQKVLPLGRTLSKFGETKLSGPNRYTVDTDGGVKIGAQAAKNPVTVRDYFAPAQFEELTDADKLSRPSFEQMDAGLTLASDAVATGTTIRVAELAYETILVDEPDHPPVPDVKLGRAVQMSALGRGAAALSPLKTTGLEKFAPGPSAPALVGLEEERYVVASADDLEARADITEPTTNGAAYQALAAYLADHPDERGDLAVVPTHELGAAA